LIYDTSVDAVDDSLKNTENTYTIIHINNTLVTITNVATASSNM